MESQLISQLPEQLRAKYLKHTRKSTPTIEALKIAAALKLWKDRNYRDIKFDVPIVCGNKTVHVKVLTKNAEGIAIGIECTSEVRLNRLCERISQLRNYLSRDSYLIVVFPHTTGEKATKIVKFVDEVWVTGNNGLVIQMMFASFLMKSPKKQQPNQPK